MKAFADLLADPIVEPVAAPPDVDPPPVADVSLDLGEAGAEALLKALDELEGVAPVEVAEAPAEVQSVEVPVLAEPAPVPVDAEPAPAEPVAAYAESAVGPVDEIVVDLESIPLEFAAPELAGAAPVDTPDAAVEVQAEAEPEVSDGFILTGDSAAEAGVLGQHDPALAEAAERLESVADTDTLSLDFEAPVEIEVAAPAPVPAGPPPLPVRSQATILVLERMLTRVKTRRVEVASEYHLAS
jgi:hypothetical protein